MRLRSLLFVPGDRPDRMEKALTSGADALILDLEDSVAASVKPAARQAVAAFLRRTPRPLPLFVRINPLGLGMEATDLAAAQGADALVVPKAEGAATFARLDALLDGIAVPLLPIAAETAGAMFTLADYRGQGERLVGLTWGAEDLSAAVGAASAREADGRYAAPYEVARSLTLFAAHAGGTPAIDTVYPAFRDVDGLEAYARRARRDGFSGMLAIHPSQVAPINAAFTPSEAELAHARAIVDAFAANPGAGALNLDGRMIDAPHLKFAQRLLAQAG